MPYICVTKFNLSDLCFLYAYVLIEVSVASVEDKVAIIHAIVPLRDDVAP